MLLEYTHRILWLALTAILVPGISPAALARETTEAIDEESDEAESDSTIEETITVIGIRAGNEVQRDGRTEPSAGPVEPHQPTRGFGALEDHGAVA